MIRDCIKFDPDSNRFLYVVLEHDNLVKLAAKFLKKRHVVVSTEVVTSEREYADAIGFMGNISTLIECKSNKADFIHDAKKIVRRKPELGMGMYRYFLVPEGLVHISELPPKWGLIETDGASVRCVLDSGLFMPNLLAERVLLVSLIRRIGAKHIDGISVSMYKFDLSKKSTVGIANYP